jgi:hypothetical protein
MNREAAAYDDYWLRSETMLILSRCRQKPKSPLVGGPSSNFSFWKKFGAGEGARTLDPDLGKVVLYH